MKALILIAGLWGFSAVAADYRLNDPSILGEYHVLKSKKHSEVQVAEVRYNQDNQLIVTLDRNETDYGLTGPNKSGVVYDGEDEPNCGSGDEPSCMYDARTVIKLVSTTVNGKKVPSLIVEITEVDAYAENDAGTTTTYTLNWAKDLPYAIPFYTNGENPSKLNSLIKSCEKAIASAVRAGGVVGRTSEICSKAQTFNYRGSWNQAMKYFFKDQVAADKVKSLTETGLQKQVYDKVNKMINALPAKDLHMEKRDLIKQAGRIQKYIVDNSDKIYYYDFAGTAEVYSVNTEDQTITWFRIETR